MKIEEAANSLLDIAQSSQDDFTKDHCIPELKTHSRRCLEMKEFTNDPYFLDQADEAHLRLKGLRSSDFLTRHFKAPPTAAEGSSLKGLAQESCVYDER